MITIAAVETALIPIVGAMLTKVSLDGTTNSGSNADLRGPIRRAAVTLGVVPATPLILTDTDLSALADTKAEALVDIAALYARETARDHLFDVDIQEDDFAEKRGQLALLWEGVIKAERARLNSLYQLDFPQLSPSSVSLGFIAACDNDSEY